MPAPFDRFTAAPPHRHMAATPPLRHSAMPAGQAQNLLNLKQFLKELELLVMPVECPGCGLHDVELCGECAQWLSGPLRRVEQQVPRLDDLSDNPLLPVWAVGEYTGPARGLVVSWKDRGREDLTTVFRKAAVTQLRHHRQSYLFPIVDAIVPMPSSGKSLRHRGRDHLAPVAKAVAAELQVPVVRVLSKRARRDQVGLSARARGEAVIRLRRSGKRLAPGRRVLLFDDVVTTGATLAAARDALGTQGCEVVGALVLAATPPRVKVEAVNSLQMLRTGHGENVSGWV